LLAEYEIVLPQHPGQVRSGLPAMLEDAESHLTGFGRELFQSLYEELTQLDEKVPDADGRIQFAFQKTPDCRRIAAVEEVGPLIATAIIAAISNGMPLKMDDSSQRGWGWFRGRTPAGHHKCRTTFLLPKEIQRGSKT
jgi:hypothetical protein